MQRDPGTTPSSQLRSALPESATHVVVAFSGVIALLAGVALARWIFPQWPIHRQALLVMAATACGIFLPDLLWQRVWRRQLARVQSAGNAERTFTKFLGLIGCLGFVALLYWLFPEYYKGKTFYGRYWSMLELLLPVWLVLALPYLWWVDRRMSEPQDALWRFGRLLCGQWRDMRGQGGAIAQLLLGWLVKGYFLPLMFTYLCNELTKLLHYDFAQLADPNRWYDFAYFFMYFLDVALVSMTYVMSLRLTDTQLRSTEPTLFGWVIALLCYQPFWSLIGDQYLDYDRGFGWSRWLGDIPWLYGTWATLILLCVAVYVWATISFGGRFSNLTHRGIITNGPYRFTRHPAYIAKNLSWWLIAMPFMLASSWQDSLRRTLLLLALNGVYFLRAKTEERHLGRDPVYRQYSEWIGQHGLLRFVHRLPLLGALARLQLR
ncbi:MAG: isoprenylcysteine carboxylmethyltransferase family protein [Steroidobacteraceae bacterium]